MSKNNYDNSDYDSQTIILTNTKLQKGKNTEKQKTHKQPNNSTNINAAKVERDEEAGKKLKIWGKEYGQKVTIARVNSTPKMTQAQLAQKLQVKPDVVKDIENGTGLYKPNIANIIFRILKVKRN